jgi:hypothetical protein
MQLLPEQWMGVLVINNVISDWIASLQANATCERSILCSFKLSLKLREIFLVVPSRFFSDVHVSDQGAELNEQVVG